MSLCEQCLLTLFTVAPGTVPIYCSTGTVHNYCFDRPRPSICERTAPLQGFADLPTASQTIPSAFSSTTCFPFPSSLKKLDLYYIKGMGTLELISNLTSLTQLELSYCGDDLRGEGLWRLITQGHLSELHVIGSPKFFVGLDPMRGLQDEDQEKFLRRSCRLRKVQTDDAAGFLAKPICNILSSSLTKLTLHQRNDEVEVVVRFTKEQEDALRLLASLLDLKFGYFHKLQCLPAGLHTLRNLRRLNICGCELIRSLPEDGLPVSLQVLDVYHCGNGELKEQCRNFIQDHPGIKLVLDSHDLR